MRESLYDLFTTFKLSLKIFLIPIAIGLLVFLYKGLFGPGFTMVYFLRTVFCAGVWMASLGLFVCAGAFIKPDLMGPLNNEKQWRVYFYKFGIVRVMLVICVLFYVYCGIFDIWLWYILR